MNIWDIDRLVIFIAFVIPGFISLKVYELLVPGQYKEVSKQLIDTVAYSCLNYGTLSFFIFTVEKSPLQESYSWLYFLFYFFVLFISPVVIAFAWKKIRSTDFVQKSMPHPIQKPWDWFFSKKQCYWVKIVKNDGTTIAGRYAESSFASSAPAPEQIFIEQVWILNKNGGFERPKHSSAGAMVLSTDISHIEFRN